VDRAARAALQQNMVRLADGDRSAFSPLYKLLWPVLRAFVHRQLPQSEAEDVAQDALLKVFGRASRFDPERDALAWVLGIAAFEVRTARKRTARRKEELVEPLGLPDPQVEEDAIVDRHLEAAAFEVLGTLRPLDVEALRCAICGRSPPVSAAAFRKRVERAIKRLKLAWRAKHGVD
jgi:RNA polymerase sigma-70 factor, ECF subfamily